MTQTPAGWHPDPQVPGQQRYWDGQQWTDHRAPMAAAPVVAPPKKKRGGKILLGLGAVVAVIVIASVASNGGGGSTSSGTDDAGTTAVAADNAGATQSAAPAKPKKPSYTAAQENAMRSAKNYLGSGMGFSRAGLIGQLTSPVADHYKHADAVFAVNHIKVNWRQQAVVAAKNYTSMMGFSRDSLIRQLTSQSGSKFTPAQANYAADKLGL